MMSYEDPPQRKLFYIGVNIDKRIRKNHPLRKIQELIDFDFIYNEVRDKYGYNGNESKLKGTLPFNAIYGARLYVYAQGCKNRICSPATPYNPA